MAHYTKRVNLRVPDDMYDLLVELANDTGDTVAGFVRRFLESQRPVLKSVAQTFALAEEPARAVDALERLQQLAHESRVAADQLDAMVQTWKRELGKLESEAHGKAS